MLDGLTLWAVNRMANRVSSSVSFSRVEKPEEIIPASGLERASLNIRIPFCAARCPYCAFPGELYSSSYAKVFITGLSKEMMLYSSLIGKERMTVERVYLSGGTPTLLHKELGTIRDHVDKYFDFQGKVALEASPTDLKDDVLRELQDLGITQLSIGVQSFNEGILSKVLGRPSKKEQLVETLRRVMDRGFDYVNIDLMFSLPNQTREILLEDLETAVGLGVNGISTYPLMMLPYTALARSCKRENAAKGKADGETKAAAKNEENSAAKSSEIEQYLTIVDFLRSRSYKFRTLWSFSMKPESYEGPYEHDSFIGLGPRAWGVVKNRFTINSASTEDYIATLKAGKLPIYAYSELKDYPVARLARSFYYGGIQKSQLSDLERKDWTIRPLTGILRLLGLLKWEGESLRLTDKALSYGSIATKKIAAATLTKMDEVLRAA